MIVADRYHHVGGTYGNISRARDLLVTANLGLTPQAKHLPPLRGSSRGEFRNR